VLALTLASSASAQARAAVRILFIGNSLTYANDLPDLLRRVARAGGDSGITVATVARADYGLEDHWGNGEAARRLRGERWDFVVLQQGPSSLPESQRNLRDWSARFAPLIRAAGAVPVLYMVWPDASRLRAFDGVREGYRVAAAEAGGIFAPSGEAWRIVLADGTTDLYSADGFHPTRAGSYLAALVLLGRMRGLDPRALPVAIPDARVDSITVRALQRAAHRALETWPAR
jgi:hypothetical protein